MNSKKSQVVINATEIKTYEDAFMFFGASLNFRELDALYESYKKGYFKDCEMIYEFKLDYDLERFRRHKFYATLQGDKLFFITDYEHVAFIRLEEEIIKDVCKNEDLF